MGNRQTNKMFWKIDKLNVFFLTKTFFDNIQPIEKKVMTGFRHGVKKKELEAATLKTTRRFSLKSYTCE